jgi:hypothetical protein
MFNSIDLKPKSCKPLLIISIVARSALNVLAGVNRVFNQEVVIKWRLPELTYNRFKSHSNHKKRRILRFSAYCFSDLKVWQMLECVLNWSCVYLAFGPGAKSSEPVE